MTLTQTVLIDLIRQACSGDPTEYPSCRETPIMVMQYAYEQVKDLEEF